MPVLTRDVHMLHGLPVWWAVIGCIYHELFQALSYLAVAVSAGIAYFVLPIRRDDAG